MDTKAIDQVYVLQAAAGVGLELQPSHIPGVIAYFQVIADFAAMVSEFPLDEATENAAVFMPCSPTKRE